MNALLWIVQAILAVMFALSGLMKSTQPRTRGTVRNWLCRTS